MGLAYAVVGIGIGMGLPMVVYGVVAVVSVSIEEVVEVVYLLFLLRTKEKINRASPKQLDAVPVVFVCPTVRTLGTYAAVTYSAARAKVEKSGNRRKIVFENAMRGVPEATTTCIRYLDSSSFVSYG